MRGRVTRRNVLKSMAAGSAAALLPRHGLGAQTAAAPLQEFTHAQVRVTGALQEAQRENVTSILMGLDEDSILKPFRAMSGKPAPGADLGGWYGYNATYDYHHDDAGLAPGANFGQWTSALARLYAASTFDGSTRQDALRERALRLHTLLHRDLTPQYFAENHFAGYDFDKLVCGLMDAHRLLGDGSAWETLERVRACAMPALPGHAVDREIQWKIGADASWLWDETYTIPENLYLVSSMGAGDGYRRMAEDYLLNRTFFEPLAAGQNVLGDHHAYSYVNSLCSAMQAYLTGGSAMHLRAAQNGFDFLEGQSWATGGWGPEELLRKPGYDELFKHLATGHNGFETPCGSYAHMKLTRYLLRATRDGRYGDSMERVLFNTVLGALPLQPDGSSYYSSDYNNVARRIYSVHKWPCCSGTLPQVVADYGINSYLHEAGAVWVVLYQPSQVRWTDGDLRMELRQTGAYPEDGHIALQLFTSSPADYTVTLRIPAWAGTGAQLTVNGRPVSAVAEKGFTSIRRRWSNGDLIGITLPMPLRMEPLPANGTPHWNVTALVYGPVVLFALREPGDLLAPLSFTRDALLKAERTGPREWRAESTHGSRRLVPFPQLGLETYSTYYNVV